MTRPYRTIYCTVPDPLKVCLTKYINNTLTRPRPSDMLTHYSSYTYNRWAGKVHDSGNNKVILWVKFVLFSVLPVVPSPPNKNLCNLVGICSDLHLFDARGERLRIIQGTQEKISLGPVENVVNVQTRGSVGCYTIFEEENFKGEHFCWTGDRKQNINHQSIYSSTVLPNWWRLSMILET